MFFPWLATDLVLERGPRGGGGLVLCGCGYGEEGTDGVLTGNIIYCLDNFYLYAYPRISISSLVPQDLLNTHSFGS